MSSTSDQTADRGTSVLDNPIWSALSGPQRSLRIGSASAARFPGHFVPFAAVETMRDENFRALATLLGPDEEVAMFTLVAPEPPSELEVTRRAMGVQMVATRVPANNTTLPIVELTAADAPEMRALAELTKPGPFRMRTHELGRFLGVRDEHGTLMGMTGERLRMPGFTEVSGVCTHPDHRGKQLAHHLVVAVANAMLARGETPMLHAFADNAPAITLYEKLGFVLRTMLHVTFLRRSEVASDTPVSAGGSPH